ncbi:Re/Si-specific NAD(P)(+) transhydrogenase subunit alpha [Egibacter rhizosphaerae]|uniref:proton-translocating NAD(P)(+) transhydrogenase n=1 Tax=Egibacter rhizosphaerae TaxID=1670831 RepID=A0A411YE91_9ACTN|nr:Re/Si-specific NAD(P)(+) transhydrogenase subunit alpha [Egibacter rhizosphaerae]QBI19521.1 Re/Si-specific NAD(P)(+) transhydrogenase subunit alpha [Egibacter rhizosphaerae]
MLLFVPRERAAGERRVAVSPETVTALCEAGIDVRVERGAGEGARWSDDAFAAAGAELVSAEGIADADVVARVSPPSPDEARALPERAVLLGFVAPHRNREAVGLLAERKITTLALELLPRVSRAQAMDALSSQANVAGYRAVIVAAHEIDKYFPLFMTAAGTIRPAQVVVLGAGVAGLQAVATARRLGAIVHVSDIREAAKEEVESLGGKFIEVPEASDLSAEGGYAAEVGEDFLARQRAVLTERLREAHAVITTAQVPGRPAPRLVTAEMVEAMPAGSVLIDVAAADGGNCELTDPAAEVHRGEVRIIPGQHLPSDMAGEASALFARNIRALMKLLVDDSGSLALDLDDEVVSGALLTHDGGVAHAPTAELLAEGAA